MNQVETSMEERTAMLGLSGEMRGLLRKCLQFASTSGHEAEFVRFMASWAQSRGFETDLWETDESQLAGIDWPMARHLPLAGRPTLVIALRGSGGGRSVIFNAHSDVVGAPDPQIWRHHPWQGVEEDGVFYGRGACDVKGPLVSALWAMCALQEEGRGRLKGDVLLELVPGEEDCVGVGTLTSLQRGHLADAAIILEPTENMPRCASRGGCRFEITVAGRSVHGTVKWLGEDAILGMRQVLAALDRVEQRWLVAEDPLFRSYPIGRPITVDSLKGGRWQGMVCDACSCAGYLELLPEDSLAEFKRALVDALHQEIRKEGGPTPDRIRVEFSEEYRGHRLAPDHELCQLAERVARGGCGDGRSFEWAAFNSGCEAGLRHTLAKTPTLVWGPGTLAKAHAVDESVGFDDVQRVAGMFQRFCAGWSGDVERQ